VPWDPSGLPRGGLLLLFVGDGVLLMMFVNNSINSWKINKFVKALERNLFERPIGVWVILILSRI
jgi:hypothetical protein